MKEFLVTIQGARGAAAFRMAANEPPFNLRPPEELLLSYVEPAPMRPDWIEAIAADPREGKASWGPDQSLTYSARNRMLMIDKPVEDLTLDVGLATVEQLPFEVCSFGPKFRLEWLKANYDRHGFADNHIHFGWGCAFRGRGHLQLVSRRWLDFGPWRVLRRPDDTTVIQFHDLALTDPAAAFEQAKDGHRLMSDGFYHLTYPGMLDLVEGNYLHGERRLEIVVPPGTTVTPYAMKCAGAVRHRYQTFPDVEPRVTKHGIGGTETIAYIFSDEAAARAHLHDLWLRELECWVVDATGKHRIDDRYQPTPQRPAWARALDAS